MVLLSETSLQTLNSLIQKSGQPSLLEVEGRSGAFTSGNSGSIAGQIFEIGNKSYAGKHVTETSALTISAVYRAVSLISGSLAMMPLDVLKVSTDGTSTEAARPLPQPATLRLVQPELDSV